MTNRTRPGPSILWVDVIVGGFMVLALAATVLLTACHRTAPDMELAEAATPASGRVIPESELVKEAEMAWWNEAFQFFQTTFPVWIFNDTHCVQDGTNWRIGNQVIAPDSRCISKGLASFRVHKVFYGDDTDLTYGAPTKIKDALVNEAGRFDLVDNRQGADVLPHVIEKTFEVTDQVSTTMEHEYSMDVTLGAEQTLKGTFSGVEAEAKFTETFGQHFATAESKTKAESTTREDKITDTIDVPAGKRYMIAYATREQQYKYPFAVNGVYDFNFSYSFEPSDISGFSYLWNDYMGGGHDFTFANLSEFEDMLYGVNVNYPRMTYFGRGPVASVEYLMRPELRTARFTGSQIRTSRSSITLTVLDVTDCGESDLDAITSIYSGADTSGASAYGCLSDPP